MIKESELIASNTMSELQKKYQFILNSIKKVVKIDEQLFLETQNLSPNISIKINSYKITDINQIELDVSHKVIWAKDAFYLKNRPAFYAEPMFYAGAYYVMDSSSMFLEYILNKIQLSQNALVLDIAAAPGGKSVLLSNYLSEAGLLISNEINFNRAKILHYNLSKWGKANYIVTNNDSSVFSDSGEVFDAVICDAPCTGSGLFRKYPEWIYSLNENLVQQCVNRQKEILKNIFPCIKENGFLIYSTCSLMSEENENIAEFIIENGFEYIDIPVSSDTGIIKSNSGIRFFPHLSESEGFFYAVFQKKQSSIIPLPSKHLHYLSKKTIQEISAERVPFSEYLSLTDFHKFYSWNNKFYLLTGSYVDFLFQNKFKYLSIGTLVSEHKSYVPASELALSVYLSKNIPRIHLSKSAAQKYLKKESLKINAEKKLYLMSYQHLGLGWAKVLDNRVNNYFPSEWRIIKDIETD